MKRKLLLISVLTLFGILQNVHAQIPKVMSYLGILTDNQGTPKPDGIYAFTFSLYTSETGGVAIWFEDKNLTVKTGLFSTFLGDVSAFGPLVIFDHAYWLGIKVGVDPEMPSRIKLASVAYSFNALRADTALYVKNFALPLTATGSDINPLFSITNTDTIGDNVVGTAISGNSITGYGVMGSSRYAGVYGYASSGNGVYGKGSVGVGVYGYSDGGYGSVKGTSNSGPAMYGYSDYKNGVMGVSTSESGIYGHNWGSNSVGYAGYFWGRVTITGIHLDGGGGIRIDHPLDPANKYLYQSSVSSPDMKNIFDGVITLDKNGEADVALPEYFSALNSDFRYQLTGIGSYAPLYVAQEIIGNTFRIAGGSALQKVSWQITGIRKDAFANKYRIPVEELKQGKEKGHYLNPVEHGLSADLGITPNLPPSDGNFVPTSQTGPVK
ncbi:MAG: hypothetical protein HYV28_07465 [Ignavibacteriales bacterium]|nr:hypothetical protein [Ignavibacteriales bacterium]